MFTQSNPIRTSLRNANECAFYVVQIRLLALTCLLLSVWALPLAAQIQLGDAVMTCFSDYTPTTPGGYVFGVVSVQNADAQPNNQNWNAPMWHAPNWTAANFGEVFGVALDNTGTIFVTATTVYGNYPFGPAGGGGVYRVNGSSGAVTHTASLANSGPGLGNISYDADHDQVFVSNFEDGKIYRLTASTLAPLNSFDPYMPDGGTAGFAPLGERVWGLQYNPLTKRLYYAVWWEDFGRCQAAVSNEIRSIAIDGAGDFVVASDTHEFWLPNFLGGQCSGPVSDIAFNSDGRRMLLAERTKYADVGSGAHRSRVIEYIFASGSWNPEPVTKFQIGQLLVGGARSNSAGGVDYGYERLQQGSHNIQGCDETIWATGDALHFGAQPPFQPINDVVYGLQQLPASGGDISDGVLIDADGNLTQQDKTQIGDVEVFDLCRSSSNTICNCDDVRVTFTQNFQFGDRSCCWELQFHNTCTSANFTNVVIDVLTSGVTILNGSVTYPSGWIPTISASQAAFLVPAGIPYGSPAPGSVVFCLDAGVQPSQSILVTLIGKDGARCEQEITFECEPGNVGPPCGEVFEERIECGLIGPQGYEFNLDFVLHNQSWFAVDAITLHPPSGITISPSSLSFNPDLGPGSFSGMNSLTIGGPNAQPGDTICFNIALHDSLRQQCCRFEYCVILPECKDCCEGMIEFIETDKIRDRRDGRHIILNGTLSTGTTPIRKASATIVAAWIKRAPNPFGPRICAWKDWEASNAYFNLGASTSNLGGLPQIPTTISYVPNQPIREARYGEVPAGVSLSPQAFRFTIGSELLSSARCHDSLRFCIRYSFTDVDCRTCDTLICYETVKRRRRFWARPIQIGNPLVLNPIRISLENFANGQMQVWCPVPIDAEPAESLRIVGMEVTPITGVDIASLSLGNRKATIRDRTAFIDLDAAEDEKLEFAVNYRNPASLTAFENVVRFRYIAVDEPESVYVSEDYIVTARTPQAQGGDKLGEDDISVLPDTVKTYALYFAARADGEGVDRVRLSVDGGTRILAVGPSSETQNLTLAPLADADGRMILAATHTASSATLKPGDDIRPIYLTLGGARGEATPIYYSSYNAAGELLTEERIELQNVISSASGGDDVNREFSGLTVLPVQPNPVRDNFTLQFTLKQAQSLSITLHSADGREVRRSVDNQYFGSGAHAVVIPADNLAAGSYFVRLGNSSGQTSIKVQIVK